MRELKRSLLVVGGGIEAIPGIRRAREMGLRVVVSDLDPLAPGFEFADEMLLASTYDVKKTIEVAHYTHENRPLSGVMCIATDVPMTVAAVADALGLPGIPLESARIAMDKQVMKDKFAADGIPIPWYSMVSSSAELRYLVKSGPLLVIKPADSRGARGVLRLLPGIDLDWAFQYAHSFSPTGRVMVEKFLDGPQVSTESLVIDGKVYTIGFADRNYSLLEKYSPHIIEDGGELPSRLSDEAQVAIRNTVAQAVVSFGITNGIIKGDIVLYKGQPVVIELAARLSGGFFCSHEIPLNTGVDFIGNAIRLTLGDPINIRDLIPKFNIPVCQRYFFPTPGKVEEVYVPDWIRNDTEISLFDIRVKPGDIIDRPVHHPSRAGVVIATGKDRDDARNRAECAIKETRIHTVLI